MNKLWSIMIVLSLCYALCTKQVDTLNTVILNVSEETFTFVLPLLLLTSFWNGILYIVRDIGLMQKMESILHPLLQKILPDIKHDSETLSYVAGNVVANMFGLGSAATPMGLKAMEGMQKNNVNKNKASRSMVTFLVLNTAGVTIIPTTIIALRHNAYSEDPLSFVGCAILATICASFGGLLLDRIVNYRD